MAGVSLVDRISCSEVIRRCGVEILEEVLKMKGEEIEKAHSAKF